MLTAKRPYLLKAYYDWLMDNDLTPHLVVNAEYPGAQVPQDFVQNGQIVLNISPGACGNLDMGMEMISFKARFKGIPQEIFIPLGAVMAIYARENGDGVVFENEEQYDYATNSPLHVVDAKQEKNSNPSNNKDERSDETKENRATKAKKGHSHLKVIK